MPFYIVLLAMIFGSIVLSLNASDSILTGSITKPLTNVGKLLTDTVETPITAVENLLTDIEAFEENLLNPGRFLFRNTCYTSLDNECFFNGPPYFHPRYRQWSSIPSEAKNVKFYLFTPNNPEKKYELKRKKESLMQSPFNTCFQTIVIIHGFDPNFQSFLDMKDALMNAGNFNAILVDWRKYAKAPYYQSVANTRTAGARVAKLLQLIWDVFETDGSSFHCVGHSLGAHVCGYVGKILHGLKRITGLDPANGNFEGLSEEVHLNENDAEYVDIIHTNGADNILEIGFGFLSPIGDMDFYANDGHTQPGCEKTQAFKFEKFINFTELASLVSCSHSRAYQLFTESIKNSDCKMLAVQCDSVQEFNYGRCPPENRKSTVVGFPSEKIPDVPPKTSFVFRTNIISNYCTAESNKPDKGLNFWSFG